MPLLHWGTSLRTCMVQVPLPHPQGTEEPLPAVLGAVPWPRATPMGVPSHLQAPLGAEGVEGSTAHSSRPASVWQVCDQNLSHAWASPLIKVCIFPTGCGSLRYSLILLPRSFCLHHTHAVLVFILKHRCSPLSRLPGCGMFYAFFLGLLQCWSEVTWRLDFLAVKLNILRNGKFYWNPAALARV